MLDTDSWLKDLRRLDGQEAGGPLVGSFERLAQRSVGPFTCAVLGLSREARDQVLVALSLDLGSELTIRAGSHHGLFEVRFRERGFAVEGGGRREEFDSAQAFVRALHERMDSADDVARAFEPIILQLPGSVPGRSLRLLFFESHEVPRDNPAALSLVLERSEAALVVGERDLELDDAQRRAIELVCVGLPLVVPVVTPGNGQDTTPERAWWEDRSLKTHPGRHAAVHLGTPGALDVLDSPSSPVVAAARTVQSNRSRGRLLELAQEQCSGELRRLTARRSQAERDVRMLKDSRVDGDVRVAFEKVRAAASDELSQLVRAIEERGKRALLAEGSATLVVAALAQGVAVDDFEQTIASNTVRLALAEDVRTRATAALRVAVREHLRTDLQLLRDGLTALRAKLSDDLARSAGTGAAIDLVAPDENEVWNGVSEVVDLEVRYKGEVPRRGFVQRLGEGRRPMYVLMMVVSMFGAPFGMTRGPSIAVFSILLFVVGFFSTYRSWKRQDGERMAKELERAQEQLETQMRRAIGDALREESRRLSLAVGECGRSLARQLEGVSRRSAEAGVKAREREVREMERRSENLAKQLQELEKVNERLAGERSRTQRELSEKERELLSAVARQRGNPSR